MGLSSSLITHTAITDANRVLVFPVDTTLSARRIVGIYWAEDNNVDNVRVHVEVANVLNDSAATFTWSGGGQAAVPFIHLDLENTALVCPAADLTTVTLSAAVAITGTMSVHYLKTFGG